VSEPLKPPYISSILELFEKGELDEEQIVFISENREVDKSDAEQELLALGQEIKHKIQQ
jgi:hypothetical protein